MDEVVLVVTDDLAAAPSDLEPGFRLDELTVAIEGEERSSATLTSTYGR